MISFHIFIVMTPSCRWSHLRTRAVKRFYQGDKQEYDQRYVWPRSFNEHFRDWSLFLQKVAHPLRTAEAPIKNRPRESDLKKCSFSCPASLSFLISLNWLLQTELWGCWWVQLVRSFLLAASTPFVAMALLLSRDGSWQGLSYQVTMLMMNYITISVMLWRQTKSMKHTVKIMVSALYLEP